MGIGGCILVFAAGAVLAFGVDWHLKGVDVPVVGVILMIAGLLGLLTYGAVFRRRRLLDRAPDTEIVEERHYRQDY
jgi:xanthosine utilization system XapX-like protein